MHRATDLDRALLLADQLEESARAIRAAARGDVHAARRLQDYIDGYWHALVFGTGFIDGFIGQVIDTEDDEDGMCDLGAGPVPYVPST